MSPTAKKPQTQVAADTDRMEVGQGLFIVKVQASSLKEQELNAQQMDNTKFDRLVENVRQRGALESIPYCHQPNGQGPISIVSGHHRAKAARLAGLQTFPVLVDTNEMPLSLIRAKQIAHNELTGAPDEELLRQMIEQIDNVDDLLVTGLPEDYLPSPLKDNTQLALPHAEFEWRQVAIMFLPEQLTRFNELIEMLDSHTDTVGYATLDQFEGFSKAMVSYGQTNNIKNMAAVVDRLTQLALREIEASEESGQGAD